MCCADSLIDLGFHFSVLVAGEISAQDIGIVGSGELVTEFLHPDCGLGVALGADEMHAFPEDRDVRSSRL